MTSKERILKAMEGKKPDIVPIAPHFWGSEYIWKVAGIDILELMHGDKELSFTAYDKLYQRHKCDLIFYQEGYFGSGWLKDKIVERDKERIFIRGEDGTQYEFLKDGHQVVRSDNHTVISNISKTGDIITNKNVKTKADIDFIFDELEESKLINKIIDTNDDCQKKLINKYGDTVLMVTDRIAPFIHACYTLGFESSMIMMQENPSIFFYLMDRFFENDLVFYKKIAAYGYDAVIIAESWASADIISPGQYEKFAFPYQKAAIDAAHKQGLKVILYSTGYLIPFLPKMCKLGMDAISVESDRKNQQMDIAKIREIAGKELCIFGNFDSENLLLQGTKDDIDNEVIRQIDSAGQDGAFIMGTGSPVCDNTEPQKVDWFIQLSRKHGIY
jgi:uroporphyrinogen-III decarboxylase